MKRSQIILLGLFLLISGAMYIPILMNAKTYEKKTKKENKIVNVATTVVENKLHKVPHTSYGQVSPNTELMIAFEVQGKLLQGDKRLKPGISFNKDQLLYKIDATESYLTIKSRKMALSGVINQNLPDIALDFPGQEKKWEEFIYKIQNEPIIPSLPSPLSRKEFSFWSSRNMLTEYYSIASAEERIKKYFYYAPFSGTVTEVYSEPGSIVNPGVQVAKIARTGEYEIKVPVSLKELDKYTSQKTARFTDANDAPIATGAIIRVSDVVNQRTQSADVYYSVKPEPGKRVYNGLYLNAQIDFISSDSTMALPRRAVIDGKVMVLEGTKIVPVDVDIISRNSEIVYVKGLKNGQIAIVEEVGTTNSEDIIYKSAESDEKQ